MNERFTPREEVSIPELPTATRIRIAQLYLAADMGDGVCAGFPTEDAAESARSQAEQLIKEKLKISDPTEIDRQLQLIDAMINATEVPDDGSMTHLEAFIDEQREIRESERQAEQSQAKVEQLPPPPQPMPIQEVGGTALGRRFWHRKK